MKRILFVMLAVLLVVAGNMPAGATEKGGEDGWIVFEDMAPDDGSDSGAPSYVFSSVEELETKFREMRVQETRSAYYIDQFFENDVIYLPMDVEWLRDDFRKITVYVNYMAVYYVVDGKWVSFSFYPPNGGEETGEQFFNEHVLNEQNLIETVEYEGTTIHVAEYYDSGAFVYAWQQDGLYFHWWEMGVEEPSVALFVPICKAVPYAVGGTPTSAESSYNPSTGR